MPVPHPHPWPLPPPPYPVPPREAILIDGELAPADADTMPWYIAYAIQVETYHYDGWPDVTMTLYPRVVCNQDDGCPDAVAPPPTVLTVTSTTSDDCNHDIYDASAWADHDGDVTAATLSDGYGATCGDIDDLTATLTHTDGSTEELVGYRTE